VKVILFDLLGVIFPNKAGGSRKSIKGLYDSMPQKSIGFDEFYGRYKRYIVGDITGETFWAGFGGDIDGFERSHLDSYEIIDNLGEITDRLKSRYALVAVTNHPSTWIEYLTRKFRLTVFFERIYVSSSIRMEKTDKEMYRYITYDLGVNPQECVLVDDQKKNLAIASSCEFKTIHINSHKDGYAFKPDVEIHSLKQLADAIEKLETMVR